MNKKTKEEIAKRGLKLQEVVKIGGVIRIPYGVNEEPVAYVGMKIVLDMIKNDVIKMDVADGAFGETQVTYWMKALKIGKENENDKRGTDESAP